MATRPRTVELDLPFAQVLPDRLRPMLPMPAAAPFDSTDYCFDVAWDGVRALASIDHGEVRLWGRDLADLTPHYPEAQALAQLAPAETIVDGEIVISDSDGRPDPVALESRQRAASAPAIAKAAAATPVTYIVYDLLYLRGRSLLKEPLTRRRSRLADTVRSAGQIYVVEPVANDGLALFDAAREKGLEAIIAKRCDSPYRAGQRHPDWLQVDVVRRQDFVVLGFVPEASNQLLEALIVGTYDGCAFHPAGRVVGGFDRPMSVRLRRLLDALPSALEPDPRWADERIAWVVPQLVINIKFSEWDRHGQLRFPIFNGLRPEVAPQECVRTPMIEPPEPATHSRISIALPRLPI